MMRKKLSSLVFFYSCTFFSHGRFHIYALWMRAEVRWPNYVNLVSLCLSFAHLVCSRLSISRRVEVIVGFTIPKK